MSIKMSMHARKFRELHIGQWFKFEPGTDAFNVICRKVSARKYEWKYGNNGRWLTSSVGTINVGVRPIALTP